MNLKERSKLNYSTLVKTMLIAPTIPMITMMLCYFTYPIELLTLLFVSVLALIISAITMVITYHRFISALNDIDEELSSHYNKHAAQ